LVNNLEDDATFAGLTAIVAVAETLGFRAAAERLGVTPAAVSRAVGRVEQRLGARLFERTTRRVGLTREGERYAARCREALAQMNLAVEEVRAARAAPHGTLAVTASPIVAPLLSPRLARFAARHPQVRVELRLTDRLVAFAEGGIDVALRVGPLDDDALVARVVARPRWVTVASATYLARRGTPREPADLAMHDCLRWLPPHGKPRPWTFRDPDRGRSVAFEPRGPLDVDHGDVLASAARGDLGVAQVLDFMVDDALREGRLVEVLAPWSAPGPKIQAVHPPGATLPRVRAFVEFLTSELA
jgi:DNA-binding transcriptional LysR family regulator